ncbi:hypothetical protein HJ01_00702 [Flavobacterium frigoris PS1]|uniref:Uncharacterized protein n=1 Tax=Flavobacterium frigoris (strain PS1) TaxID=1086011 RepID=H7FNN1_FLAFP|nr:hypothetical protein HJ01_00702 [Flavobacterium frigoris PS1]
MRYKHFHKIIFSKAIKELPSVALSFLEKNQFYFKWLSASITAKNPNLKQK